VNFVPRGDGDGEPTPDGEFPVANFSTATALRRDVVALLLPLLYSLDYGHGKSRTPSEAERGSVPKPSTTRDAVLAERIKMPKRGGVNWANSKFLCNN